jgi:hypothetical protein
VDDDTNPPRYQPIARQNPNLLGEMAILGLNFAGFAFFADRDLDGVPEDLDFERVVVSIEPDGTHGQPPVGEGIDTHGDIFPIIPYQAPFPDVLP